MHFGPFDVPSGLQIIATTVADQTVPEYASTADVSSRWRKSYKEKDANHKCCNVCPLPFTSLQIPSTVLDFILINRRIIL